MKKAVILTYGCQMNKHDSEVIAGLLNEIGFQCYNELIPDPDMILINTCAVRQNAENRALGRLGEMKQYKDRNPELIIGLCGCVAQELGAQLLERAEFLDFVVGPADIHNIAEIAVSAMTTTTKKRTAAVDSQSRNLSAATPHLRRSKTQAWVSIISGCNNYCSYCIVPFVRGPEISREPDDILSEIETLLNAGYKEITLLGQNVNSYGNDLNSKISFPQLLKKILEFKADYWLRFVTSHPKDLSDELISVVAESPNICRHLHLPAQSGSTRILQLMNRKYSREHYLNIVKKLKTAIPEISLTTDIIAGFPGESEKDFWDTYSLLEECQFGSAFIFKYSARQNTKAADFSNQLPQSVIEERHKKLLDLQIAISDTFNRAYKSKILKTLVENVSPKDDKFLTGRTEHNKVTIFQADKSLIGEFCKVKISSVKSWTLFGDLSV